MDRIVESKASGPPASLCSTLQKPTISLETVGWFIDKLSERKSEMPKTSAAPASEM